MTYRFDAVDLKRRLLDLPNSERLAFAALVLDRALPNFLRFESETGVAGGAMLRGAQAKVWGLVEGNDAASPFFGLNSKACELFAPDSESHKSLYTSSALDAVSITCNILDYVESKRVDLLVESASLLRDSVDMFIQLGGYVDSSTLDLETRLLNHPLMQEELGFQNADLQFLEHCHLKNTPIWPRVLRRSVEFGYSNLRMLPSTR